MRDARYVRLISWTLQSGSEQLLYLASLFSGFSHSRHQTMKKFEHIFSTVLFFGGGGMGGHIPHCTYVQSLSTLTKVLKTEDRSVYNYLPGYDFLFSFYTFVLYKNASSTLLDSFTTVAIGHIT